MNENIGINTDDCGPKIDVHMGVHSINLVELTNRKVEQSGTFGGYGKIELLLAEKGMLSSMPHRVAVQLIKQSALGRAIEETQEYDLRAQGIKRINGPKGSIVWPSVVKMPANTFVKRK